MADECGSKCKDLFPGTHEGAKIGPWLECINKCKAPPKPKPQTQEQHPMSTLNLPALARALAPAVAQLITASDMVQMASVGASCDTTLSPRSRAAIFANDRDRFIPAINTAPSNVIANLAAGATSAQLVISDDAIARGFKMTLVTLDSTTPYNSIVMQVLIGGQVRYTFSGAQLDPTTNNGCVGTACQMRICAGSQESIAVQFVNVSAAALGAAANVRVQGNITLEGDPEFAGCWGAECKRYGVTYTPGGADASCSCQVGGGEAVG